VPPHVAEGESTVKRGKWTKITRKIVNEFDGESHDINGVNLLTQLNFLEYSARNTALRALSLGHVITRLLSELRQHRVLFRNYQRSKIFQI
jgi:hypothetical protein